MKSLLTTREKEKLIEESEILLASGENNHQGVLP